MNLIHIPPESAKFLNILYRKATGMDINLPLALNNYRQFHKQSAMWFHQKQLIVLSEGESVLISNIQFLLDKRDGILSKLESNTKIDTVFDELLKTEFELANELTRFNNIRSRSQASPIPSINDFLIAAWVFVNYDVPQDAIRNAWPVMTEYVYNLEDDYNQISHTIKDEIHNEFAFAFEITRTGLYEVEDFFTTENIDSLNSACYKIKEGASLLNYYLEWKKNRDEEISRRFSKYKIPIIGSDLQILLEDSFEGEQEYWDYKIELIQTKSIPVLMDFWEKVKPSLFVKASKKYELTKSIDAGFKRLIEYIEVLKINTPENQKALKGGLISLSGLFTSLDKETLKWNELVGTGGELIGETMKGVYFNVLPDVALQDILVYLRNSPIASFYEESIFEIEEYFKDQNRERLLAALEKILNFTPRSKEGLDLRNMQSGLSYILCTFCGAENEPSRLFCQECDAKLMFREVVSMEQREQHLLDHKETVDMTSSISFVNITDLPLPPPAEPLVRVLKMMETGKFNPEIIDGLVRSFIAKVTETYKQLRNDRNIPRDVHGRMLSVFEEFMNAAKDVESFLITYDPEILKTILKNISEASVKAGAIKGPEEIKPPVITQSQSQTLL